MIELPPSPMWKDFSYGVRVGITLSAAFSNIIDIDVFVADCGAMESCKAQLEEFSNVSIHRESYHQIVSLQKLRWNRNTLLYDIFLSVRL